MSLNPATRSLLPEALEDFVSELTLGQIDPEADSSSDRYPAPFILVPPKIQTKVATWLRGPQDTDFLRTVCRLGERLVGIIY